MLSGDWGRGWGVGLGCQQVGHGAETGLGPGVNCRGLGNQTTQLVQTHSSAHPKPLKPAQAHLAGRAGAPRLARRRCHLR